MRRLGIVVLLAVALAGGAAFAAEPCPPTPGADAIWARSDIRFVLVGEVHGMAETQAAFVDLVCAAAATGRPVVVALEQNNDGQAALDAFLASNGGPQAVAPLIEALGWQGPLWDGRSSVAALEMLQRLRRMKAEGQIVGVTAFLDWSDPTQAGHELKMAEGLIAASKAAPDALVIGLMGNYHASKSARPGRDGQSYRLAADYLPAAQTISLFIVHGGGSAWGCMGDSCGTRTLRSPPDSHPRGVFLDGASMSGFDGVLSIGGPVTASPPAVKPDATSVPIPKSVSR